MNIQRLKFAWARGARMQWLDPDGDWQPGPRPTFDVESEWRIHSDDEHLQYGPVSTLLRNKALSFRSIDIVWMYDAIDTTMALARLLYPDLEKRYPGTYEEKIMFILFIVELLADEGL